MNEFEKRVIESAENLGLSIGVATIVVCKSTGRILMGGRLHETRGAGTKCVPGGNHEEWESFVETGFRELQEETGISDEQVLYMEATQYLVRTDFKNAPSYLTNYLIAVVGEEYDCNPPKEPDSFSEWDWYSWEDMDNILLFQPFIDLLASHEDVKNTVDSARFK